MNAFRPLILALLLAAVCLAEDKPLLTNGDMSAGDATPTGWTKSNYHEGEIKLSRDTDSFKSAPASLRFETVGVGTGFAHQRLAGVKPGQTVNVTCQAKVSGKLQTAQLALQVFDETWKQIAWLPLADLSSAADWKAFTGSAKIPENAANVLLGVSIKGDGGTWLDDVAATIANAAQAPARQPPVAQAPAQQPPVAQAPAEPLPVAIPMTDPAIRLIGRFDTSAPDAPRCAWSAASVSIRFRGDAINVKLNSDNNNDRWQVVVDGKPTITLKLRAGEHLYRVASDLPDADHDVELVKAVEPIFGTTRLLGFQLSANGHAVESPVDPKRRRIEVIGDSISCGYGNLAASHTEKFSPDTENAYYTYGAIAARALDADYVCIAWSGKLMSPTNTIGELYDRTLPSDAASKWDFTRSTPDAVIIALGTNDFAGAIPEEDAWTNAYSDFITRLRVHYPQSAIYVATSPMMSDQWDKRKPQSTLRRHLDRVVARRADAGDTNVRVLAFAPQDGANGIGADWHPSVKTHQIMAGVLVDALKRDLRWTPPESAHTAD